MKNCMHLSRQLFSVAVVTVLTLSIVGCPATTTPPDDPPPGQTLDTDSDGVFDQDDDCPNTPDGANVDDDGCEVPVVVIVDDDGDGVANEDDDCLTTPTGEQANASGCAPSERDTDGDGVNDDTDTCPSTPSTVTIDANGCPVGDPDADDDDNDGVGNDIDQCLSTPSREAVDANGCSETERDSDGDGVMDSSDTCPETPDGEQADANGCAQSQIDTGGGGGGGGGPDLCGDGNLDTDLGEECDDGNLINGDGCSGGCRNEVAGPTNNSCSSPMVAVDGRQDFSNIGATTDGPDEPGICAFFGRTQVESDIWYTYTSTCTGELVVSLCGSKFDTKMAVYDGPGCPSAAASACSDDDCGSAQGNIEARVAFQATEGNEYTIRIGGFNGAQGDSGRLTITCGPAACGTTSNDCFAEAADDSTGCNDASCCATVCATDQYCCDVAWDSFCASEAAGLCTDGFPACQVGIGSCQIPRTSGGCGTVDCCNTVCDSDPFCCINEWDASCVDEANSMCFLTCGARSGDCFAAHDGAGCSAVSCCELVCPDDPFCCQTTWDADCAAKADTLCR